jgi:hypothetical protein
VTDKRSGVHRVGSARAALQYGLGTRKAAVKHRRRGRDHESISILRQNLLMAAAVFSFWLPPTRGE